MLSVVSLLLSNTYGENVINVVEDGQHAKQVGMTTENDEMNGNADTVAIKSGENAYRRLTDNHRNL